MKAAWDFRRSLLFGGIALAAIVFLAVWAYKNEWLIKRTNPPQAVEHPAIVQTPLIPTNLEQAKAWFGPWSTVSSGLDGDARLVLIDADGSTQASSWAASVDGKWTSTDIPQIDQLTYRDESVWFTTGGLAIYKVAYGQPFLLEQTPNSVYAFVNRNGKHVIVGTTPRHIKQTGHEA